MAGAYLEINRQDAYIFQANVLLNGAAVELYQSTLWFTAAADPSGQDATNGTAPFINVSTLTGQIAISNNGTQTNSQVNVTLASNYTQNLGYINSAFWSLVCRTSANLVYTLDRGRLAVVHRGATVSYQ